ncbi:AAA family ATPase [Streptosporangiaceae bacterium NEAU-GS5]|nr:AAA family ATPase [Streptosporangiaceae bacterium NEAU-GS5]
MPTSPRRPSGSRPLGRRAECDALDQLLEVVRAGESRVLTIYGEPGIGKSELLDYLVRQASDCHVVSMAGVQSEMELPFAALHQVCAPMLDRLGSLPEPQRDALGTAFALRGGPPPDRFRLGLAVLGLFAVTAEDRPLVCVVDDVQWLDDASAQVLSFVARRLVAESVACVFASREPGDWGLPEMQVRGLADADARALLLTVVQGPLDEPVLDQIVAEARGNPLALLELPRGLTPAELAGGFGIPVAEALPRLIEESFLRHLALLSSDARRLLLLAAADRLGDPVLVWRAAAALGITAGAAAPDLIQFGTRIRFRHPLVRSAVYRAASPQERMRAHAALADATDAEAYPERRAWHRAYATAEPDEDVAAELERSAERAEARGGLAAAAAFLQRAVVLTPSPARRAERALAAAQAEQEAGAAEAAQELLAAALAGPLDERQRARAALLRAEIAFTAQHGNLAPPLLLDAARRLEPFDAPLARETYLQALAAAMFAGRLAEGGGLPEAAAAARAAPPPLGRPRACDLLLDALGRLFTDGVRPAGPMLRRALRAFTYGDATVEEERRWLWLAVVIAMARWDDEAWRTLADRHVDVARQAGALAVLPVALMARILAYLFEGDVAEASALSDEVDAITSATRMRTTNYGALAVAAWRGRAAEFERLRGAASKEAVARGEGSGLTVSQWASAVLYNALGRYEDARAAAEAAFSDPLMPGASAQWAAVELVEAAVRSGAPELAARALRRLTDTTQAAQSDWARGIEARCRALVEESERFHREAIDRLSRTPLRAETARAHLLYGEWLRRERRRLEAREQLRQAHEMFAETGMEAFAERAARELGATGESARRRTVEAGGDLTARELQIARLAGEGLTNPEIGSRLFMSPRTVEYHLHKVFTKRGIASRTELGSVLGDDLNS